MVSIGMALLVGASALFSLAAAGFTFKVLTQVTIGAVLLGKLKRAKEANNEAAIPFRLNDQEGILLDSEMNTMNFLREQVDDDAAAQFVFELWDLDEDWRSRRILVRSCRKKHGMGVA